MNTDDLLGFVTPVNPTAARFLQFREDGIESTFQFTDVGEPGLFNSIGDGITYTSNLFDTNDILVGTKDVSVTYTQQLGNQQFLALIQENIKLPGGTIETQGTINVNLTEQLIPQNIAIIGGTGIYDGASGLETVRQLELGVLDVLDISLVIVT